ncbi:Gfo/Idh/MocA family oxidoreductase [Streptomyces tendae]|uniref:Gfo/Idh/MocA family protein n=1 Tax=Streptomyces tendae TaxID=1932 RepID=UPI0033C1AC01
MTTRPRAVRLAVVGCGLIGREHLRAWRSVSRSGAPPFGIVAVCDADELSARQAADEVAQFSGSRPQAHLSVGDLLEAVDVDAVDICLPVHLHAPAVEAAAACGVHAMVEKPLARTIDEGRRMVDAMEAASLVLALAENHRRSLGIRTARWLLRERAIIGAPKVFHAQRSRFEPPVARATQWRAVRALGGGGWAIDNGAHLLDALTYLFGPAESVTAVARRVAERPLVTVDGEPAGIDEREDLLLGLMNFTGDVSGVLSCISSLPGDERFHFSIQGTKGSLVDSGGQLFHAPLPTAHLHTADGAVGQIVDHQKEYLAALPLAERDRLFPFGLVEDFPVECADFLRAVAWNSPVEINGRAGLRTLATSLAFYESSAAGRTVRVDDVLTGAVSAYQDALHIPDPDGVRLDADPPGRCLRRGEPASDASQGDS